MRLPKMMQRSALELKIPDLAGGLNLRDGLSEVLDNQLIDCKNMWWRGGILKTRPGFMQSDPTEIEGDNARIRRHNCFFDKNGKRGQLCSVITKGDESYIHFFWIYGSEKEKLPSISSKSTIGSYFVCQKGNILYCFTDAKIIYSMDIDAIKEWKTVNETDIYVPTVLIQCAKIKTKNALQSKVMSSGTMIEGFNLLSKYYKMTYNAYNPEIVTEDNPTHIMQYHIIENVSKKKYAGCMVTAKITNKDGNVYTHTVTLDGSSNTVMENKVNEGDGLLMRVRKNRITFCYSTEAKAYATVKDISEDEEVEANFTSAFEDDIEITAPYIAGSNAGINDKTVFGMTECEWFGGGTAGISGGTRLFLCGNKSKPNLVVWSGLNNPLYFSENSYFYVGDTTGKATGFGKQSDKLIIFKENETWYTQYEQNVSISASDLINQNVVDYAASNVYFPLIQIHSAIGCTYPETVQLCRNRLVWLGSDGKVYTLISENQYNENNIFCVSEMVERRLKKEKGVLPSACDWNGYYCLCFDKHVYLMDYNCYGYTHINGYSKTEDANIRIPWYYWELYLGGKIFADTNDLSVINCDTKETGKTNFNLIYMDEDLLCDKPQGKDSDIYSSITTKIFDFGRPSARKVLDKINLQLGNNDGKNIKVTVITENGEEEMKILLDGTEKQSYTASYIDSKAIYPCIRHVLRMGIKLESKGVLAIDGMSFKYRITGGAR